ncbi:Pkinase-domain-containing protein [Agrocybe pediades]|nr:Pkinase-domain-containing protein [Agrocybe pediades]
MYQATYGRMSDVPPPMPGGGGTGGAAPTTQRRHPLGTTNAVNHQNYHHHDHDAHPVKQQQQNYDKPHAQYPRQMTPPPKPPAKASGSPPLPRQNSKTVPPSPPQVIVDKNGRVFFNRVGFLGEGGFARVYEVKDPRGMRYACKVITKSSLKTKKAKTKLYAEIKIHRSLQHPNIVHFQDCFEDELNVYMTLELCTSGSLMDLLRRRRRFTEPESRFFMVQLIGACHYMHTHQVIHRDLKLGNLFLDTSMNVKVGDFGLAALIEKEGERKKTICGTPNYIAPEVLFDTANGHSFEVDTWSIGVILYTLIVGRPPFQTKDVKAIYKRIRDNEYEFPPDRSPSSNAQNLIQQILTPNPSERPTLHQIVDHAFFTQGTVPSYIPTSAHDAPPDFRNVTRAMSEVNLRRLRKYSLLDVNHDAAAAAAAAAASRGIGPSASIPASSSSSLSGLAASKSVTSSLAQQEKEFQKAVQPGSPISALLSSARQPLMMGTAAPAAGGVTTSSSGGNIAAAMSAGAAGGGKESALLRKLQAVSVGKESPLGRRSVTSRLNEIVEETTTATATVTATAAAGTSRRRTVEEGGAGRTPSEHEEEEMRLRKKELEAQKARIVAQMAPVPEAEDDADADMTQEDGQSEDEVDIVRVRHRQQQQTVQPSLKEKADRENIPPQGARGTVRLSSATAMTARYQVKPKEQLAPPVPAPQPQVKLSGFDAAAQTLTMAFEARVAGKVFRGPSTGQHPLPDEKVFIVSWVDYCNRYGMGYALTDGSVGVHFNDSTTLVLSPDKIHFDYISTRRQGSVYVRKSHTIDVFPDELKSKVYLLKHFEKYIMDRLYGEYEYTFADTQKAKGMEWVQKYLRMKHVIVFKLSHDVLQFNFYDHSKLILSSSGMLITHIDKHYKMTRWSLSEIMALSLSLPLSSSSSQEAADHAKFIQRLVDKLHYCKEVLISIRTASAAGPGAVPEESEAMRRALSDVGGGQAAGSLPSRTSKMSLR